MWCAKPKAESRVAKITVATELVTQRNHPACGYVRNASCSSSAYARDTIGTIDLAVERDSIVVAVRYTRGKDRDEHHVGVQIVQIPERIVVDLDATSRGAIPLSQAESWADRSWRKRDFAETLLPLRLVLSAWTRSKAAIPARR
jgi:hypothetical protein